MKAQLIAIALLAACGGKPAAPTMPSNQAIEAPPTAEQPPQLDTTQCENRSDMFGPFTLTDAQAAARYGRAAKKYPDAPTPSKKRAIEVCGIPASRAWLQATTCAGGETAVQKGRVGSVGAGGRCGAIIDHYQVECPEGGYDVYIDVYQCGPNESFM